METDVLVLIRFCCLGQKLTFPVYIRLYLFRRQRTNRKAVQSKYPHAGELVRGIIANQSIQPNINTTILKPYRTSITPPYPQTDKWIKTTENH